MNKDRVEGKVKDISGRVQRQAGEWTDDTETQVKGAAKQAEGKVQNTLGKMKDAAKKTNEDADANRSERDNIEEEDDRTRRKAS